VAKKIDLYVMIPALTGMSALGSALNHFAGAWTWLLIVPAAYWTRYSYRRYLERLEDEKRRAEDMASLHLRTIEALALAIGTKDYTTHSHLRRVEVYAVEIGKKLGLSDSELTALRAAALLHDIGKLAVPEHILSKPGVLSAMEFEKMKIHPAVGAEILDQVRFPYPVAPIVRSHHERWDGAGYPAGLRGEAIPIGARILAAVDCLDALSSERQYRRAMPLSQAIEHVTSEAGKSFDPRVVGVLANCYAELERMTSAEPARDSGQAGEAAPADYLASIAAAGLEAHTLFEFMRELGASLNLDETLSVLALRLKRLCPYDCVAIYILRGGKLIPEYVIGENFHLFSSLEIPLGEGISGWVADKREPVVNGNPSVEPGYLNDPSKFSTLNSALSVPLEGTDGVVGVLTLYQSRKDAFTQDHLRVLQILTHKVALSIENALRYRDAEMCAVTDGLTGLPNARSLFLHLDAEIARCKRDSTPFAVLVCDLDNFKRLNDRFGHLEGNKVLRTVAQGLGESCRQYDYVARMGGDEFVVVLPGYPAEAVHAKVRILSGIATEAGRLLPGDDPLSMSVGAAIFPVDGTDAEQLLAEADRRMYQVKQQRKGTGEVSGLDQLRSVTSIVACARG
jgi:diguanylate cyclase (GGDEF)-like protein/putative nucleotidyltransferase with HDIG domain